MAKFYFNAILNNKNKILKTSFMIKSGMTVTPYRMAMSSPTVPATTSPQPPQKSTTSRVSNFSVASLLADHRPKSQESPITCETEATNLSTTSASSPRSPHSHHSHHSQHSSHQTNNDRERSQTPHSSIGSEEYDEEDSIVDIEDINSESIEKSSPSLVPLSALLGGHGPIRPTPSIAFAAAAAAFNGMGAPWPPRQMPPGFAPPGFFAPQGFPGQMSGGEFLLTKDD